MELVMRKDVPVEETWDLLLIYKTEEEFQEAVRKMTALAEDLCVKYPGKLQDADTIVSCLDEYD